MIHSNASLCVIGAEESLEVEGSGGFEREGPLPWRRILKSLLKQPGRRSELCQIAVQVGRRGEQEGGVCCGDGRDRVPENVAGISGRT